MCIVKKMGFHNHYILHVKHYHLNFAAFIQTVVCSYCVLGGDGGRPDGAGCCFHPCVQSQGCTC